MWNSLSCFHPRFECYLHATFQPGPSPAVVRREKDGTGHRVQPFASLPSSVLRRLGFELGSPDHESVSNPYTTESDRQRGEVVVRESGS